MIDSSQIGTRLKNLREQKGISQQKLGQFLGVKRESINAWEMGIRELKGTYIHQLADFFGVSTDYLLCRVDYRSPSATLQGICEETGLSSEAVQTLMDMKSDAVEKWQNPYPYQDNETWLPDWKQRKETVFNMLNLLLSQDELLEDLLLLSKRIDEAVLADKQLKEDGTAERSASQNKPGVLSPDEMKEYREYLISDQSRKLAYRALGKIAALKDTQGQLDIQGMEWFCNLKAKGGDV